MEYIDGSILQNSFVLGLCLLILASFVAGFIDAIAGGAGLVLVPSFILAGLPPQIALGQEKLVSTLGTLSAIFNFIKSKKIIWNFALIGVPIALLGAYAGARAILFLDENMVGKIIATFMPFGLFFSFLPKKQSAFECEISGFRRVFIFPLMAFIIGFYDGFFGGDWEFADFGASLCYEIKFNERFCDLKNIQSCFKYRCICCICDRWKNAIFDWCTDDSSVCGWEFYR